MVSGPIREAGKRRSSRLAAPGPLGDISNARHRLQRSQTEQVRALVSLRGAALPGLPRTRH